MTRVLTVDSVVYFDPYQPLSVSLCYHPNVPNFETVSLVDERLPQAKRAIRGDDRGGGKCGGSTDIHQVLTVRLS